MDAAEPAWIIEAEGLFKTYGDLEAVRGVDLKVPPGICLSLLGPNGAGKTTTMRMIMGLATPTAGSLRLFGMPLADIGRAERRRIGLVPQDDNLDPDLSVRENLEVYAAYFGLERHKIGPRVDELLDFMVLGDRGGAKVMALSGGMRRRLVLARALIADPDLVILDEPTTGLDPQARVQIWRTLLDLKNQGKTLLLTSHYMDEVERLADRIVLIDHGEVLATGTPRELIKQHVKPSVVEIAKPLPQGLALEILEHADLGDSVWCYTDDAPALIAQLPEAAALRQRPANLEDVFLHLTGRALRDG